MSTSEVLRRIAVTIMAFVVIGGVACRKEPAAVGTPPSPKTEAPAPVYPTAAPTISLNATPSAIMKGQSTTLNWNASNATSVVIDNGIGTVESAGKREISPSVSTTYSAKAAGLGGSAVAEARVTVTTPAAVTPSAPVLSDADCFSTSIKDAFFDYDSYEIRADARESLLNDARALNERANIRLSIEGHCDERGSEKYNLALGDRRANTAKEFLVNQGINGSRIDTTSYGEEQPFCEEHDEQCWQLNRRAHLAMR
jgi:peptidoglycan-associated lipoprotein